MKYIGFYNIQNALGDFDILSLENNGVVEKNLEAMATSFDEFVNEYHKLNKYSSQVARNQHHIQQALHKRVHFFYKTMFFIHVEN